MKNDEEIIPPKLDIPTFNEDSEAQRQIQSELGDVNDDDAIGKSDNKQLKRGSSNKNAADSSCAKIDKATSDMVNAKYVLSSNMDQYARIDRDAKFAFTIELCEIIQLDRIEIAYFEMFSSYPKEFKITAADAEKTAWEEIGNFEAKFPSASSKTQKFEIGEQWDEHMFKFIRFEMLSYQGDEPQCTLTWLKVFGFGQYNPAPDGDDGDHENEPPPNDPIKQIVGVVKNIITGGGAEKEKPVLANSTETEHEAQIIKDEIVDSYYDCWFQSAILCFCSSDCVEFINSPFFDIYIGPYQPAPPQLPPMPKNEPKIESKIDSNGFKNETQVVTENNPEQRANSTDKNDTKIEPPKKKDDPGQLAFKNQIKEFEANLSRVGDYLEKLSSSYKQQMNEMRNSFNRTSTRLTKVETQNREVNETLKEIVEMISFLYKEINRLDVAFEKTILCTSVMIGFQIIMLLLWCRPRRDRHLTRQLAKIEIQLDLLRETTAKLASRQEKKNARRYTLDMPPEKSRKGFKNRKNAKSTEQINENVDNVFIEET